MYDHKTHRIEHWIVSLRQPYLWSIVHGKVKAPVEFGAKCDVSIDEKDHDQMEKASFDPYSEGGLIVTLERYKARTSHYPARGLVDQSYRTCKNQEFCKQYGIRISGPQLGHPSKDDERGIPE